MKTKDLFFISLFLFSVISGYSQVAINTTGLAAEECAILDLSSGNKGLLIPRMGITEVGNASSPVDNPVNGLLIFNQLDSPEIPEGLYMWSSSEGEWIELISSRDPLIQSGFVCQAGELYEDNVGSTPSVIYIATENTYEGWKTANQGALMGSITGDVGNSTADQLIIGEDGFYFVLMTISMQESGSNGHSENIFITVFKNSAATQIKYRSDESYDHSANGSTQGLLELAAGDALDLRFLSDEDNASLDIYHISLIVKKIGDE